MPIAWPVMRPKKCVKDPMAVVPKDPRVGFFFSQSMYSLSELTPIVGETQRGLKRAGQCDWG